MNKATLKDIALKRACGWTSARIAESRNLTAQHIREWWYGKLNKMTPEEVEELVRE